MQFVSYSFTLFEIEITATAKIFKDEKILYRNLNVSAIPLCSLETIN